MIVNNSGPRWLNFLNEYPLLPITSAATESADPGVKISNTLGDFGVCLASYKTFLERSENKYTADFPVSRYLRLVVKM